MVLLGNFTLRARLLVGFISVALITGVVGGMGYVMLHRLADSDKMLYEKNTKPLGNLAHVAKSFQRTRVNIRDLIIAKTDAEREKFSKRLTDLIRDVNGEFAQYRKEDSTDEERKLSQAFEKAWSDYQATLRKVGELVSARKQAEATEVMQRQGFEVAKAMNEIIDKMIEANEQDAKKTSDENLALALRSGRLMLAFIAFSVLVALTLGIFITRSITRPLAEIGKAADKIAAGDLGVTIAVTGRDELGTLAGQVNTMIDNVRTVVHKINTSTITLASSSEELSATSEDLRKGAQELSGQTEQVVTAMTEVSQTIMDMAKNATQASEASTKSTVSANTGKEVVHASSEGMRTIAETVQGAAGTIEDLGRSTGQIGEIVAVINGIADQTNLLALNAAIEAARAGEQGRGFAVVADEVRKLAERSSQSTKDIADKISAIQAASTGAVDAMKKGSDTVDNGVALSAKASTSLDDIVAASGRATDMVQRIAAATEEQSAATEQVTQNMENIADISRRTAASTEQIRASSDSLAKLAAELKETTAWFKLNGHA
ncbi:MAG TPA: methyl-accepting chemotaxis protein [Dissulfurispiraceae bacterium]|nr:methyl-accepting chemotaxis protein [Dissulfurispiraceae bacterium]